MKAIKAIKELLLLAAVVTLLGWLYIELNLVLAHSSWFPHGLEPSGPYGALLLAPVCAAAIGAYYAWREVRRGAQWLRRRFAPRAF